MPVTHSAMANTRAVPSTASRYWRRRNWMLRSVTFHMSASLHQGGSDEPDPVVVGAGEPDVAVGAGHDVARERNIGSGGVECGDLPAGRDAPDPAVEVGEPQVPVGTGGDVSGEHNPRGGPAEGDVLAGRGDPTDLVAGGVPEVAVRTDGQTQRAGAMLTDHNRGDLPVRCDASDPTVHGGEPQRPVRP